MTCDIVDTHASGEIFDINNSITAAVRGPKGVTT
jgi:hypothetical protein